MINYFPPQDKNYKFLQTNRSDRLGSIWSSFNLDFQSKLGVLRLAKKLVTNTTSSDDANLGLPVAFEFYSDLWWAICGTRLFVNTTGELTSSFVQDTSAYTVGDSTTQFDVTNPSGTTFRYTYDTTGTDPGISATTFPIGSIVTITLTNLAAGNRGTFTVTGSGANYFEVTNAAGVVESNKTINTGSIAISGGTIGRDYVVNGSDLAVFNSRLWATTSDGLWSKASTSSIWTRRDTIQSGGIHMMVQFPKFDVLYYKDTNTTIKSIDTSDAIASSGFFFFSLSNTLDFISCMAGGSNVIWIGTNRINAAATSANSLTQGSIVQWDGFSVQASNIFSLPSGGCLAITVVDDVPYALDTEGRLLKFTGYSFVEIARLPIGDNMLTNATINSVNRFIHFNGMKATKNNTILVNINNLNHDNAGSINENLPSGIWECDLATGNFTHRYSPTLKARSSSTVIDFGQNRISGAGAIKVNTLMSSSANGRSTLLAGYTYYTDASNTKSGIYIESPSQATSDNEGQKGGYVVTTKFNSMDARGALSVQNSWQNIYSMYRKLLDTNDKITVKYRNEEITPVYLTATWTSTTTFTTATDVSLLTGYEVEVIQGLGSGKTSHITSVVNNAGTYTVTVDETYTSATGTSKVRIQNWKKISTITTSSPATYDQAGIGVISNWVQFKIAFLFTGDDELENLIIISQDYNPAN